MAIYDKFKDIDRGCFTEVSEKISNKSAKIKERKGNTTLNNNIYIDSNAPAKTSAPISSF